MSEWPLRYLVAEWTTMSMPWSSGALAVGRGEGVVGHRDEVVLAAQFGNALKVHHFQKGIGRGFHPQHPGVRPNGRFHLGEIREVDEGKAVACRAAAHVLKDPVGAAIKIIARHNMGAGIQELQDRTRGGHAGGGAEAGDAVFQIGHTIFQGPAGRVAGSGILIALMFTRALLHIGRGGIDGGHDGAGHGIWALAGMDGAGGEALAVLFGHGVLSLTFRAVRVMF